MQSGVGRALRALATTALPSLKVVGLVYTGVSAIAALVVVVTAAVAPKPPILQQVTDPAREAVTTLIQPTTNIVNGLMPVPAAAPAGPIVAPQVVHAKPTPPPFVDSTTLDITIADPTPVAQRAPVAPRAVIVRQVVPAPAAEQPAPADEDADQSAFDDAATLGDVQNHDQVAQAPAATPSIQIATVDEARPLPTPTVVIPTTPEQVKAQVDAANQAAIDTQKAAAARAKADADAANQAAIDAQKRAASAPAMADAALTLRAMPTPKAADAAKLAKEQARVAADAANQAAIDAARAVAKPQR